MRLIYQRQKRLLYFAKKCFPTSLVNVEKINFAMNTRLHANKIKLKRKSFLLAYDWMIEVSRALLHSLRGNLPLVNQYHCEIRQLAGHHCQTLAYGS